MMPVDWPIAAPAAEFPLAPARSAGRDRLSAVRADFFLDDESRLSEQERALMGGMLARLLDELVDEIAIGLPPVLAEQVEIVRPGILHRLWKSGVLDRPELVGLLLRRSDEQRLASTSESGPVEMLVGDDDERIAAAAMALTVARGRRRDRFGRLGVQFDDLMAEEAVVVANLVAVAIRAGISEDSSIHDQAIASAASQLLSRHDESNRLEARVAELAFALVDAERGTDVFAAELGEAGEMALLSTLLSVRGGIMSETGWAMLVEQGASGAMLLAKLAGLDRQTAARILVATGDLLGIRDPAEAIGLFDRIEPAEIEAHRNWLRLPSNYRDALDALGLAHG